MLISVSSSGQGISTCMYGQQTSQVMISEGGVSAVTLGTANSVTAISLDYPVSPHILLLNKKLPFYIHPQNANTDTLAGRILTQPNTLPLALRIL